MTYIMVTNDDGVSAPGILALAKEMRKLGRIRVVAPATNQSAIGHKKTLFQDISVDVRQLADGTEALAVGGSPADCIAMASMGLAEWPPNIVVSGINYGANMGQDVTYSGTVTAALEATIQGVPAVAVSQTLIDEHKITATEFAEAARVTARVVARVLEKGLPPFTILNLNIPRGGNVKGIRLTRQGVRIYHDKLERDGEIYRIVGPTPGGVTDEEGTDLWAVHNGYASLTPLHLDLTAHRFLADLAAWDIDVAQPTVEEIPH